MLYHVEFKSKIDGSWIGARSGHSMVLFEAEEQVERLEAANPHMEYRIASGAYPSKYRIPS